MLWTVLATSFALQATSPPQQRPLSHAKASALRDSLEAAELRLFREWGDLWRSSEASRHPLTASETEIPTRNLQLHCHPDVIDQGPVDLRGPVAIRQKTKVPTIVKDPNHFYAICPTWMFAGGVTYDERDGIDLALIERFASTIAERRQALIDAFDSAATLLPADDWIVGQRVRLRVDQRHLDTALVVARTCAASRWWCIALTGYVTALRGDLVPAESIFTAAMAAMPAATRCAWTDLTELIDLAERAAYARLSCTQRDSANVRLWWLADPLYIDVGNDRRVEHHVRRVVVALHAAVDRDDRYDWRGGAGLNVLERVVERYGWPSYTWWGGPRNEWGHSDYLAQHASPLNQTYTTFEYSLGRMHAFPTWRAVMDPLHAKTTDWDISPPDTIVETEWWTREHFAPRNPILRLPDGQVAMLRRQDNVIFAFATDVDPIRFGSVRSRTIDATLVLTDRPGSFKEVAHAKGRGQLPLFMRADVASQPILVSVEFPGVDESRAAGGRTRFAIAPPPPLSALKAGQFAISDPVVLLPPPETEMLPNGADAVLPRMAGSTRIDKKNARLGVYWETYGFKPGDSINVAVWIERYTSQGILRNLSNALSITQDQNTPIVYTWTEPQPNRPASFIPGAVPILGRSLVLDVSQLAPGNYWLDVAVSKRGVQPVRGRRGFTIP